MKISYSKRHALSLALIGAVLPLTLVGCGGGGGGLLGNTPNTPQPVALTPTKFTLANGQRVTLTGTRTGNALAGKLKIEAPLAMARLATGSQNATFPFQLAVGEYGYTGTFTPPRGFNIVGNFGSFGQFTMTGQLQTATENGSFSLTTNGVTDTGIIPASGPNTPPVTPPTTGNYALTGNLAFSSVTAGSPVVTSPFNSFNFTPDVGKLTNTAIQTQTLSIGASDRNLTGNGLRRDIAVSLVSAFDSNSTPFAPSIVPFQVGQKFVMGQNFSNLIQYTQTTVNGTSVAFRTWRPVSGDVFVRAIGTNSISLEFVNVRMRGLSITGSPDTTAGEFTFNGPLSATGLNVVNP